MTNTLKPITRETMATFRNTPLVVELLPRTMIVRLKGARPGMEYYELSYEQVFKLGAENAAEQARRARRPLFKGGSIGSRALR